MSSKLAYCAVVLALLSFSTGCDDKKSVISNSSNNTNNSSNNNNNTVNNTTATNNTNNCTPRDCSDYPALECGVVDDGCGGTIDLVADCAAAGCTAPDTCQGGGVPNMCGQGCVPLTCADFPAHECGEVDDGCGGTIDLVADCGQAGCTAPETCGGGGAPNMCGEGCVVLTCADFPTAECGTVSDGCGGTIDLIADCSAPGCTSPEVCGGSGNPAEPIFCGDPCPSRIDCDFLNSSLYECGVISDNCGGTIDLVADCGAPGCGTGEVCAPHQWGYLECTTGTCTPLTCQDFADKECGLVNDGCGGVIDLVNDCGFADCVAPEICSGGAVGPNMCGDPTCAFPRRDCSDYADLIANANANGELLCGVVSDGCGGQIDLVADCGAPGCGSCTPGTPLSLQCSTMARPTDPMESKICLENASGCPGEVVELPLYLIGPTGCAMTDQRSIHFPDQGFVLLHQRGDACGEENCIRRDEYNGTIDWSQFTGQAIGCSSDQCPTELPVGHVDTLQMQIPETKAAGDYTFSLTNAFLANPCNACPSMDCWLEGTDAAELGTIRVY